AFSKKKVEERKEWLTNFMEDRRQRKLHGLPEDYLYGKNTSYLTYNDFINKELVLFSNSDNERSIPSLVDGLKPGQRKVLFTCFKRNDKREVKVAQLAGSVAEMSSYHHGEASLMMTIINLAQNFVGSNNLNLLQPIGQFGTRLHGGKDSASPRYIFTMLSPLARLLFPPMDDNILKFLYDDNQRVEPEWYIPIIPMVLINGAEGIGTGWSCKIPNFDIREVVNNIRRLMDGEEPLPMLPSYKNFKGTIDELGPNQYVISGEVSILDSTTIEITELPVRTWTQTYKEQVLEPMLNGTEKTPPLITDYKEYHTDTTVRFIVKMTEEKLAEAQRVGLHKVFKLQTSLTCNSMVLFDHVGFLKKYNSPQDILKEFFELRLQYYNLRKEWLVGMLGAESAKLSNQARFILEKIDGKIVIENKPKKELIQVLVQRGYESDPVKAWKESQNKEEQEEEGEESDKESAAAAGPDFNYLLNMPLWYLTKEKKDELCKQRDNKEKELTDLKHKSACDLWKEDLSVFVEELQAVEAQQLQDEMAGCAGKALKVKGGKSKGKKTQLPEVMPSPHGVRVVPHITAEMKAEAEKKTKKKVKSEKTEGDENQEGNSSGDKETSSLKERLARKLHTEGGTKRQATLPFKPLKKMKKRNPWSGSESDSEPDFEPPPQRQRVIRQAAAKVKPVISSDSEEHLSSSDNDMEFQGSAGGSAESDTSSTVKPPPRPRAAPKETTEKAAKAPKQKPPPSAAPARAPDAAAAAEDSSQAPSVSAPRGAAAAKKPPAAKKAGAAKGNQPSIMDILAKKKPAVKKKEEEEELPEPKAGKKAAVTKSRKATKRHLSFLDSDSDSDFGLRPSKSTAAKKSKRDDATFVLDSDDAPDSPPARAPQPRPGRSKKPVQYLEESEEDDFF
ncbi:TOP2A topoisomerase, partial [Upupa epops]|nr:TOP2A topoisomerase [Upupa epops]